jgi:hypothetical protein
MDDIETETEKEREREREREGEVYRVKGAQESNQSDCLESI